MTAAVQTVLGPVAASELGRILPHEHIFILDPDIEQNYVIEWGSEEARVAQAVQRLDDLKALGIDTIVDLTVTGLGRYIPRIEQIARQTSVNIVVATGLYTYDKLPHFFYGRPPGSGTEGRDPLEEMFIHDITVGIARTGVRAGILKCVTDEPGVTPDVERVLRSAARAHLATGVPISTHTHAASRRGLEQQAIFKEEGVDLSRVVIGHSGDTEDFGYLTEMLDAGSYLGMDRFGVEHMLTTERRVAVVAELCKRGYADQLLLSHDASCYIDWLPRKVVKQRIPNNHHHLFISQHVLPLLLQSGVDESQLDTMMRLNPQRMLTGEPSPPWHQVQ
jgi:phosphotriesterase-related protein